MVFALCLLPLLGAVPTKEARCQAGFDAMDVALGIRKKGFVELDKKYPGAGEAITKKFLARCSALPDDAIDCPSTKKGMELKSCAPAMDALQKSMTEHIEEKDPGAFDRFKLASMQSEAKANLKAISSGLKALHAEAADPSKFAFPASVGRTPALDCCAQPEMVCRADATTFAHATWKAIGWVTDTRLRYGYELSSKGKGLAATFLIRASGDPQCKGKQDTWEVTGAIKDGVLVVTDPAPAAAR